MAAPQDAAQLEDVQYVQLLLAAGADPEADRDQVGSTFQDYYFTYDRTILNERALAEREAVIAWLVDHDVLVDPRA